MTFSLSVSHKEWITTSIFTQKSCGRKQVTEGFLQKTSTCFCEIIKGAFCYRIIFVHSLMHELLYSPLLGPRLFFSFIIFFTQTVGLLELVISPSQGSYLYAGQHKHRINAHRDINALSGIRTHDLRVRAREDSSCPRPRGTVIGYRVT
jgi:hypothetical protein